MNMPPYRIYQSPFSWKLRKEGNPRATRTAKTKEEIIRLAFELLGREYSGVGIYSLDGSLVEEASFEPLRSPDTADVTG